MIFFDIGNTLEDENLAVEWRVESAIPILHDLGVMISTKEFFGELQFSSHQRASSVFEATIRRLTPNGKSYDLLMKECAWRKDLLLLREEAKETVKSLARNYSLGIIANQSAGAQVRFKKYGILDHFSTVISSFDVGVSKPNPKIFEIALKESGAKATDCFMIGDRLDNDIGPSKKLGFKTVRVLGCFNDAQSPENDFEVPDYTISDLRELENIISQPVAAGNSKPLRGSSYLS